MTYQDQVGTLFLSELSRNDSPDHLRDRFSLALRRMRWQLAGGFVAAVIVPTLVRGQFGELPWMASSLDNSVLGCTMAFLLGFLFFRKVTDFPGVIAMAYVVPAFLASYTALVVLFFGMRLDYSRFQFGLSFVLVTLFFVAVFILARRGRPLEFAVIPGGATGRLSLLRRTRCFALSRPADVVETSAPLVVDLRADLEPEWERVIADRALAGRPVYHLKEVLESLSGRVEVEHLSENSFGTLAPGAIYGGAKRYVDRASALVALVALSPLLLVIGVLVRLDGMGPALFRQQRVGKGGERFDMLKFRSMRPLTAEEEQGTDATMHDEVRITRIGRLLRRTRLDELPQLINILRGEMSWIGPRPESLALSAMYDRAIPFYRYRHVVAPGITGWAQVNQGHVTGVSDATIKLQYDFFYVKHFSMWLDLLVALRTVRVILFGTGAR